MFYIIIILIFITIPAALMLMEVLDYFVHQSSHPCISSNSTTRSMAFHPCTRLCWKSACQTALSIMQTWYSKTFLIDQDVCTERNPNPEPLRGFSLWPAECLYASILTLQWQQAPDLTLTSCAKHVHLNIKHIFKSPFNRCLFSFLFACYV